MEYSEFFDVYDKNRIRTDLKVKRGTFLLDNQYMMYVLALIERSDHTFLVTKRSMEKNWAAGSWEVPGGGSLAGETSWDAVCREVKEETGIDVSGEKIEPSYFYFSENPKKGDNYFVDIYHFHLDFPIEDISLQESETVGYRLSTFDEITQLNETDGFLHYDRICQMLEAEKEQKK